MEEPKQQDPLRMIAEDIIKSEVGLDADLKERMIGELVTGMERHINSSLISRLTEDQAKEFLQFLDTNPSDTQTVQFFKDKGVNVDEAVTAALANFKAAYVGN